MNSSLKTYKDLLFLESLLCLLGGLAILLMPDGLLGMLTQSVSDPGEIAGGAVAARLFGGALLGLGLLDLAVVCAAKRADAVTWVAAIIRVAAGAFRWSFLVGGPLSCQVLGWTDVALAVLTVQALLGANTTITDEKPGGVVWRFFYRLVALALAGGLGYQIWLQGFRTLPDKQYESAEEHFKYGSFGNQKARGMPLYLFEALPEAFPDKLPGGWESLGFVFEEGNTVPVGFHERTIGFPGIAPNCALCHAGVYRATGDGERVVVSGAPAETLDFHGFLEFLFEAGKDERFTDGTLLAAIEERREMDVYEKAFYEHLLLPSMAIGLRLGEIDFRWMKRQPAAGPGRQDAGAMLKFNLLRLPYDGHLSTSEIRHVWNQQYGATNSHRWSGGGIKLEQENTLAAALFLFFQTDWFDADGFGRMTNYFATLEPPKYPLAVDAELAAAGEKIFRSECADCHARDGARIGRVTPLSELSVDDAYLKASTKDFLDTLMAIDDPPFVFDRQQETDGLVNSTLEGLWLRAPYLHNGSVPTLKDLLEAPVNRPVAFDRGGDVLDGERVGFTRDDKTPVPAFRFDTRLRGNSNRGHTFGVGLKDADKQALIEYLKTL